MKSGTQTVNSTDASLSPDGWTDTIASLPPQMAFLLTELLGGLKRIGATDSLDNAKREAAALETKVGNLKTAVLAHKRASVLKREGAAA